MLSDCNHCGAEEHATASCPDLLTCSTCLRPIDGYEPSERDAKLAPQAGQCEECHQEDVRAARRCKADADRDARGDYLRDQQKGGAL